MSLRERSYKKLPKRSFPRDDIEVCYLGREGREEVPH